MVRNQKRERQWGTGIDGVRDEVGQGLGSRADSAVVSKTATKNNENFYMPTTQSFNAFFYSMEYGCFFWQLGMS